MPDGRQDAQQLLLVNLIAAAYQREGATGVQTLVRDFDQVWRDAMTILTKVMRL